MADPKTLNTKTCVVMIGETKNTQGTVLKRKVFYISGFDPKGPAYYHHLYCTEAEKQAPLDNVDIEVGEARRQGRFATRWQIRCDANGATTETDYEFLRWDDLMRERMQLKGLKFALSVVATYALFIRTGALWKILKTSYPTFLAGLYPIVFIICFASAACSVGAIALVLMLQLTLGFGLNPIFAVVLSSLVGLVSLIASFKLTLRLEQKFPFLWPLYVYNFAADHMNRKAPGVEQRVHLFAERIVEHVKHSDADEVLIVAHSNGTVLAVSALAEAVRLDPELFEHEPEISFLTLGESIPLCSYLPVAQKFRAELHTLANIDKLTWVDITAPRDGACFALTDPVRAPDLRRCDEDDLKPKLLSIPISKLFSANTFRTKLHRRWLRMHFQYLMAYEKPTVFSYFLITAGPNTLRAHFNDLPSKSEFTQFRLFG